MGIEGSSDNNEIQSQEINQVNNEQIEQNNADHQRSGQQLEANPTIDNEGERKQIEGKDDAENNDAPENKGKDLDNNSSIEGDQPNAEQQNQADVHTTDAQNLDNQSVIDSAETGAEGSEELNNNDEIKDSLDNQNTIGEETEQEPESAETETGTENKLEDAYPINSGDNTDDASEENADARDLDNESSLVNEIGSKEDAEDKSFDGDKPTEGDQDGNKPSEGKQDGDKPAEGDKGEDKPSEGEQDGDKPSEESQDRDKPSEGEKDGDKPSEGDQAEDESSEGEQDGDKTSEGEQDGDKPSEESQDRDKPSEGEQDGDKSSEGGQAEDKPAEGDQDGDKSSEDKPKNVNNGIDKFESVKENENSDGTKDKSISTDVKNRGVPPEFNKSLEERLQDRYNEYFDNAKNHETDEWGNTYARLTPEEKDNLVNDLKEEYDKTPISERGNNLVPESAEYLKDNAICSVPTADGGHVNYVNYKWPGNDGFKGEKTPTTIEKGDVIDRLGENTGRFTSPEKDGICSTESRALPYHFTEGDITKEPSFHRYQATEAITPENIQSKIDNFHPTGNKAVDSKIRDALQKEFNKTNGKTYDGEIGHAFAKGDGGGIQYHMPMSVNSLQKLGLLKEI